MATCRIALTDVPVYDTQVCRFHATYYELDPQARIFVLDRYGIEEQFRIPRGVKEILVRCVNTETQVIHLKPPKDPIARVAWDHGFYGKKRAPSIGEARAAVEEAAKLGDTDPVVLEGRGFIFVFAARVKHREMRIPFRWAATREAGLAEISARLREVSGR